MKVLKGDVYVTQKRAISNIRFQVKKSTTQELLCSIIKYIMLNMSNEQNIPEVLSFRGQGFL